MVNELLTELPDTDDHDAIFSVILSSLYRITNKSHNTSIENGLEELACTECFHENSEPDFPYSSRSCLFSTDFLVLYRKSTPIDMTALQNTLMGSTILEHGASVVYPTIAQKRRAYYRAHLFFHALHLTPLSPAPLVPLSHTPMSIAGQRPMNNLMGC